MTEYEDQFGICEYCQDSGFIIKEDKKGNSTALYCICLKGRRIMRAREELTGRREPQTDAMVREAINARERRFMKEKNDEPVSDDVPF